MSFSPDPKIKRKNPTRTLRGKILSGKADARQALNYIRGSNYANDQGFERSCNIIEHHLWGENWRTEGKSMNAETGLWITSFMKKFITETNLSPETAFKIARKAEKKRYSKTKKISPVKAAYIEIGNYKRYFKKCQEAAIQGDFKKAGKIEKAWEAMWS